MVVVRKHFVWHNSLLYKSFEACMTEWLNKMHMIAWQQKKISGGQQAQSLFQNGQLPQMLLRGHFMTNYILTV